MSRDPRVWSLRPTKLNSSSNRPPNNATGSASIPTVTSQIAALPSATLNQLSPVISQHLFNLPSPTNRATSNQNNKQLGPFNEADSISLLPIYSASSGSSVPQVSNNTNPDPSQATADSVWNRMSLPPYSTGSLGYTQSDGGDGVPVGDVDV